MTNHLDLRISEVSCTCAQFLLHPEIILIAKSYEVSFAKGACSQEVLSVAQSFLIAEDPHWKGCITTEILSNAQSLIAGLVIGNHNFKRQHRLACDRVKLLPDEPFAITSSHRN